MPLGKAIAKDIFKAMAGQGIRPMEMIRIARNFGGTYRKIDMLDDMPSNTTRDMVIRLCPLYSKPAMNKGF